MSNQKIISLLQSAGVVDWRFAWDGYGVVSYVDDYPADQRALVEAVLAAYDPSAGPTLEEALAARAAAIQAAKVAARDAGFRVGGVLYDSDQAARLAYGELADILRDNPAYSTPWRASAGVWVTMDAALYALVVAAGMAHVQACFAWQAARDAELEAIRAAVVAGTMTEAEAIAAVADVSTTYVVEEAGS